MITWIQLWPLLAAPTVLLGLMCAVPTFALQGQAIGGGPVREWLVNAMLLPVLPSAAGWRVVEWFGQASAVGEWLLGLLIAVNLNALLLPVLYGAGEGIIRVGSFFVTKDLELKRRAARR